MSYLPELHYCCWCKADLGAENGDGICGECEDKLIECPACGTEGMPGECPSCKEYEKHLFDEGYAAGLARAVVLCEGVASMYDGLSDAAERERNDKASSRLALRARGVRRAQHAIQSDTSKKTQP